MKEEWKVFIRGNRDRGEEIIKVLTDLGAKNSVPEYKGKDPTALYYIGHDGEIYIESEESEYGKIIMDNYREIKLPEKWKDGDILFSESDDEFAVFKKWETKSDKFLSYIDGGDERYCVLQNLTKRDFRLATKGEIVQFYERLHSRGQDWIAEKKQFTKYRWKPKIDETFWVVSGNSHIVSYNWNDSPIDNEFFNFGNCFKTKEEAEAMAKKIKELLNAKS